MGDEAAVVHGAQVVVCPVVEFRLANLKSIEFLAPASCELRGLREVSLPLLELRLCIGLRRIGREKERGGIEMSLRRERRGQGSRALEEMSSRGYVHLVGGCLSGSC